MTAQFLPDYSLFLLSRGVQPGTRLVFFDWPIDHITRPALHTLSIEEPASITPFPAREALAGRPHHSGRTRAVIADYHRF
jgi:hypothetical protein